MTKLWLLFAVLASPVSAQDFMSPEEFEEFSTGRTLYFSFNGRPYGAEQFFSGRRSLWQRDDGTCTAGAWHDDGNALCFLYEDNLALQCWYVYRENGDVLVRNTEAAPDEALRLERSDEVPLPCIGPDLGV